MPAAPRAADLARPGPTGAGANIGDAESGGWLLAAEHSLDYILRATAPGSDAVVAYSSIDLGWEQLEAVQRTYRDLVPIGCWHSHRGDDIPSTTDLRSRAHGAKLSGGRWVSLIVAPSRSWRPDPEISGWITYGSQPGLMFTERLPLA
jgi:hypothetical protein